MTLSDHKASLPVGARFRYNRFQAAYTNRRGEAIPKRPMRPTGSVWEVLRIEERGPVVGHPLRGDHGTAGGHEHLMEWTLELDSFTLL